MKLLVCFGLLVVVVYCVSTLELERAETDLSVAPKSRKSSKGVWGIVAAVAGVACLGMFKHPLRLFMICLVQSFAVHRHRRRHRGQKIVPSCRRLRTADLTCHLEVTATLSHFTANEVTGQADTTASPVTMVDGRTLHLRVSTSMNVEVERTIA